MAVLTVQPDYNYPADFWEQSPEFINQNLYNPEWFGGGFSTFPWNSSGEQFGYIDENGNLVDEMGYPIDTQLVSMVSDEQGNPVTWSGGTSGVGGGNNGNNVPVQQPYNPNVNIGNQPVPIQSGQSTYWPSGRFQIPTYTRPGSQSPFFDIDSTDNLGDIGVQDRLAAYNWLHGMDQSLFDRGNADAQLEQFFLNQLMDSPAGYSALIEGGGGFTPAEQEAIRQNQLYQSGMATDPELAGFDLQDWEEAQIAGSPYGVLDNAIPVTAQAQDAFNEAAKHRRDVYQKRIANPADALSADAEGLAMSDEFANEFAPITGIADQAARNNLLKAAARNDELYRQTASGTVAPLAFNAARARNSIYGDIAAQDAYSNAALNEAMANRDLSRTKEQIRQQGLSNKINTQSGLANTAGQIGLGLEGALGNEYQDINRWGGEWLAGLGTQAENTAANRAANAAQFRRQNLGNRLGMRYDQRTGLGDRGAQAGLAIGNARRQDQAEGRAGVGRIQGQYSDRGLATQQQRIGSTTAGLGLGQSAANNVYRGRFLPSFWDRLISAGAGAAAAFAT